MSVNIFGSSGKNASSELKKDYVDQKFKTLSTNLATKVDKTGDTISGSLSILNVCQLGGESTKSLFYNDIVMNDKSITDLHNPSAKQDAATKGYVDTRWIKSNVGYVPNLTSNTNKNGFIVSASSEYFGGEAYHVFNDNEDSNYLGDWTTVDTVPTSFWIQVKCPEKVKVYKIKLSGLLVWENNGNINDKIVSNWKWQGSNDGSNWTTLNEYNDTVVGNEIVEFIVSASAYYYYRIFVNKAETTRANPGLSYWQLYTLQQVFKN